MTIKTKAPLQNISLNTDLPHLCLVKGTAFTPQFGAGAGGFSWTSDYYTPASLEWVLQHEWVTLQIKPLDAKVEQEKRPIIVDKHLEEVIPTPPERTGTYTWKMMREDRYLEWVAMKNREWTRNRGHYDE